MHQYTWNHVDANIFNNNYANLNEKTSNKILWLILTVGGGKKIKILIWLADSDIKISLCENNINITKVNMKFA